MRLLLFLLRSSRYEFLAAIAAGILAGLGVTGVLALINRFLATPGSVRPGLVAVFAVLCLLVPAGRVVSQYLLARVGQGAVARLRMSLSRRILRTPLRTLEELGAHRLQVALTEDVAAVTHALAFVPVLCVSLTISVGCLAYLGWLSPRLLGLVLAMMGVGILGYRWPQRRGAMLFTRARSQLDALYGHFRALILGIKELKLHHRREGAFLELLDATTRSVRRDTVRATTVFTAAASGGQLAFFVATGVLVLAGSALLGVDRTTLTGYTLVLLFMMNPLQLILDSVPQIAQASVSLGKLRELGFQLLDDAASAGDPADAPTDGIWRELELREVSYTYREIHGDQEEHFRLGPISATFVPGEIVFIVGGNGSGKTTLAKLLVGLYTPDAGEILVDDRTVDEAGRAAYRQLFSVVFSDFFLFDTLLGLPQEQLDRRSGEYLRRLHLARKVTVEGGKLSTLDLSQGQRKRLALLTAYLEDRPIYLFDEWAADQDPIFKQVFYREILPELKRRGKLVLVITHDDAYYSLADRVLELRDGLVNPPPRSYRRTSRKPPRAGVH